jgi:hypothetical protein
VGASLQWEPVFSGSQSSVGASLQWVPVFSGCQSSVGASLQWALVLVGASFSGCQPVFSRCESLVGAHPHDIEADSHVRAPTRQIQANDPDLGGALQFWRRQTRNMLRVDQILCVSAPLIQIPCSLIGFPVVGSCREIALIGLLCKGL